MKEKVIVWDLGAVVIYVDESKLPFAYHSNNQDWFDLETGKISDVEFFKRHPESEKTFNSMFTNNQPVIDLIKSTKHKQYFLSNTNPRHFEFLRGKLDILNNNSNLFLSYEVGFRKPNKDIYLFVNETLRGKQLYFIDDRQENLVIPDKLGWKTFCYKNNNEELIEFIK